MRHARWLLAVLFLALAAPSARSWVQDDDADIEQTVDDLARARKELALRSLGILDQTIERGAAMGNLVEDYYFWSVRLVGCDIFLAQPADGKRTMEPEVYLSSQPTIADDGVLKALADHFERMKSLDDRFHRLEQQGILPRISYQRVLDHRIEAELRIAREKVRRKAGDTTSTPTTPTP